MDLDFPGGSDSEDSVCNAGDQGLIPGLGKSPVEGNGNPLQCSCLENSMDRGACWASAHGVARSRTQLSNFTFTFMDLDIIILSEISHTETNTICQHLYVESKIKDTNELIILK